MRWTGRTTALKRGPAPTSASAGWCRTAPRRSEGPMEKVDAPQRRRSPRQRRFLRTLGIVLLDWAAVGITVWLVPGITADSDWTVLLAAAVLGALAAVLRPALVRLLT